MDINAQYTRWLRCADSTLTAELQALAENPEKLEDAFYKDLSFDRSLLSQAGDFTVSRPHVETAFEGAYLWVVTAAARVNDSVCGDGAYATADFRFSALSQYIDRVSVGRRGYCYITDNKGAIIYHPQQQVLFEEVQDGYFVGHAPNYMKIYIKGENLHNKVRTVLVEKIHKDGLFATEIS